MVNVTINSKCYRKQFDDWLAGGEFEYKDKTYYWSAQDSNYGFGWEIEPIIGEDWYDISEDEVHQILMLIEKYLFTHKTEYLLCI